MSAYVGVVRDGAGLAPALGAIGRLRRQATGAQTQNMLTTALLIASAAFADAKAGARISARIFLTCPRNRRGARGSRLGTPKQSRGKQQRDQPACPVQAPCRRRRARGPQGNLGRAGDITTQATVPGAARAKAVIAARENGVIAGRALAQEAFSQIDAAITLGPSSKTARMSQRARSSRGSKVFRTGFFRPSESR